MITPVKKKTFSGLAHLFDGFLERKLNEIITVVNGGGSVPTPTKPAIAALNTVAVADATDAASAAALANANKAAINAVIAALKA